MRLNKFIANSGYCSRRSADKLIVQGKVKVNYKIIRKLGVQVDSFKDIIIVNNIQLNLTDRKFYYKVYKPTGYISTTKDKFAKDIVTDLINDDKKLF